MCVLQLQLALSSMSAALQAAQARLESLDSMRIPALEERLQEVSRSTAEVGNTGCVSAQVVMLAPYSFTICTVVQHKFTTMARCVYSRQLAAA